MTLHTAQDDGDSPEHARPAAYWTWAVTRAILRHSRDELAAVDLTQPQWWVLNHVDAVEGGLTRAELGDRLDAFTDEFEARDLERAADGLVHRGWLTGGRLVLTDAGRVALTRGRQVMAGVRARIHEGVSDEEYAVAVGVLRRMIRNLESAAVTAGSPSA
ncbi:MarR family winged helix-turn-helix transcriptional regulator [Streptomyces acidiscabies]|uniref:MarR family winged helix-turn-helix transcriptional regulator n=1 Tax=Streptomyces acidiscabies TaxID=42234 RepID=UPI0038F64168